jgi:hypothetical protein
MSMIEIFNPLGRPETRGNGARHLIPDLSGATIGVLENTKPNARHVLEHVARRLADRYGAADVIIERKQTAAQGAPPDMIRRLSGAAHLVFAGSGD